MTTAKPLPAMALLSLEMDLHHAERFLHLSDLLFSPPNANALVMHEHQEGIFQLFAQASYTAALMALRRCLDSSKDSTGLRSLAKAGKIDTPQLSENILRKITAFLDQRLTHSDPRAADALWWKRNESTRGELRALLAETRTAIERVTITHGRRPVHPVDLSDIDAGINRLIEDLHLAAHLKQLRDRAKSGLAISTADVLGM